MKIDVRRGAPLIASTLTLSLLVLSGCSTGQTTDSSSAASSATGQASASATSAVSSAASGSQDQVVTEAVESSNTFLDSLDESARSAALFEYEDLSGKESSWSNFPVGIFGDRQGARLGDLTEEQRQAALAVLESLLSEQGMEQVTEILAADDYLGQNSGGGMADDWTSDNYYLAFYGDPSTDEPFTVQFGGHHLALHITVGGGTVSVSPMFTGVEPTTFTWEGTEYSPMVEENEAVFGLLESMTEDQLTQAQLAGAYDDLAMGPGVDTGYPEAEGISYTELSTEQQEQVLTIMRLWVEDTDPALADELMATYESQLQDTVIGWSGSTDADGSAAYLRIDGPRFWLEYLNAPGIGTDEVHYHTVYRDKEIDYGTGTDTGTSTGSASESAAG